MSKQRIIHVAIHPCRPEKLGMVKNVECFQASLQHIGFADLEISLQHNICVEHTRAEEISARRISDRAYGIVAESARVEVKQSVAWIRIDAQRLSGEIRQVEIPIIHAIRGLHP